MGGLPQSARETPPVRFLALRQLRCEAPGSHSLKEKKDSPPRTAPPKTARQSSRQGAQRHDEREVRREVIDGLLARVTAKIAQHAGQRAPHLFRCSRLAT